ncbi:DUF3617 domain-containing protein [Novosphingobium mangrovi (ex Huang et al. 2023)]|uniref:DUF3617 domain-containing protein n=1 Tax=Novosphingobium mangrovi (ex Huang et al. 2023) TaxID=2976432 RepID=A0ABT2I000_9SPHN|nr:DUF3617 domain-containing protein [Novosphingobium mangrovi (ex Huang et al. 2023)]MCT2398119.1 DUF3617 domain-containing protein [Novosphingobium mangrovi (ex Huang et al. 2023)]
MTDVSMAKAMRKGAVAALLTAAMLPLAACGSKEEAASENAASSGEAKSIEEVQSAAGKLERPRPGSYKQTIEILDMQIAGLPEGMAEQMKTMGPKAQTHTICITDEDTDKGYKDMLQNVGKGGNCTYSKFDVSGGKLDARMHCTMPDSGEATMTMNGTVSETGSDVMIGMNTKGGQAPMGDMKMTMHLTTERVGDCAS